MNHEDIFDIKARRCKRCGGLLTSAQGLKDGYGTCCRRKVQLEALEKALDKDQYNLFGEAVPTYAPGQLE